MWVQVVAEVEIATRVEVKLVLVLAQVMADTETMLGQVLHGVLVVAVAPVVLVRFTLAVAEDKELLW